MNDLQFLLDLAKTFGVPGVVMAVIGWVWLKQGPDRKTTELDNLNVKVTELSQTVTNIVTRISVMEAIQKERDKK